MGHQDKCLFDPSGNPHHGGDHDHDHHEEEEEIDIVVEEETPLSDIDLPEQSPEIIEEVVIEEEPEVVEDEAVEVVEEVVVDESPVEAEVGYRNLSPEIPLNANLSPERQSRSRPLIFDLRNKLFNGYNPSFNSRNFYRGA